MLRQVRETSVVCKGWSDRLAWMGAGGGIPDDEALRHVLMSAHGRLEGIKAPLIQVSRSTTLQWAQSELPEVIAPTGVRPSEQTSTPQHKKVPTDIDPATASKVRGLAR